MKVRSDGGTPSTKSFINPSIHQAIQQIHCTMKGKKKPLGLPSTLQHELALGGGGGGMRSHGGVHKRKGAAPLSRKEVGACAYRSTG